MSARIYIIAGEASGDLHGGNLVAEILKEAPLTQIRAWGGDRMEQAGATVVKHIRDLAFMGFVEVISNLRTILSNIKNCKKDIEAFKPDVLVLIDYPGFNLRIAEWAKEKGIKVHYYISPQVWAWKQNRVHKIKKVVDKMYVILPFEQPFYEKFQYEVDFVGHPLLDEIEKFQTIKETRDQFIQNHSLSTKPIIAVLPGSRKQEVSVKLPIMLKAVGSYSDYQVVIAGAPTLDREFYAQWLTNDVHLIHGKTYDIISNAEFAVVTSGTATLETALLNTPEIVCYIGSNISYQIAKRLIKIKYISLVNLIRDKEVVTELIQKECTAERIQTEIELIKVGGKNREWQLSEFEKLRKQLGGSGASKKVAQSLLKTISES